MIEILLLYAFCASSFTISKAVLAYSQPIFFVAVRMMAAGMVLVLYQWMRGHSVWIAKTFWILLSSIIIFHVYCAYIFDLWSLQYMTSFKSAFFFNLSPFITALLAYFFLGETLTKKKWVGLIVGFVGCLPMIFKDAPAEQSVGELFRVSIPELVLLASVISSAIGWISMKRLLQEGFSPWVVNGIGMLLGGILALVTSFFAEAWFVQSPVTNVYQFTLLTILIIVICNIIFYNLYGHLLRFYSATFLSFAGFTCPLFAALFGYLFLHETITWHFFVGLAIVSFGLFLFYQEELNEKRSIS